MKSRDEAKAAAVEVAVEAIKKLVPYGRFHKVVKGEFVEYKDLHDDEDEFRRDHPNSLERGEFWT